MSSFKPIDSKREEYRKYLEKSGALDKLTKVLVMLYDEQEKPSDAVDYIRKQLGDNKPDDAEFEVLKADMKAARLKIEALEDEIKVLKERLAQYEPTEKPADEASPITTAEGDGSGGLSPPHAEAAAVSAEESHAEEDIPPTVP